MFAFFLKNFVITLLHIFGHVLIFRVKTTIFKKIEFISDLDQIQDVAGQDRVKNVILEVLPQDVENLLLLQKNFVCKN